MRRRDFADGQVRYLHNPKVIQAASYPDRLKFVFEARDVRFARSIISRWPGYAPTPLYDLKGWAAPLAVQGETGSDHGGGVGDRARHGRGLCRRRV